MRRIFVSGLFAVVAVGHAHAVEFRAVAESGEPVPGMEPDIVFDNFGFIGATFQLNNAGDVFFEATLRRTGSFGSGFEAAFFGPRDAVGVYASEGQTIEIGDGLRGEWNFNGNAVLNNASQLAYGLNLEDTDGNPDNDFATVVDTGGTRTIALRSGEGAPGIPGGAVTTFISPGNLNDAGQIARLVWVEPGTSFPNNAYYYGAPGDLQLLGYSGMEVPGAGGAINNLSPYVEFGNGGVGISGSIGFRRTIFAGTDEGLRALAIEDEQAPGMDAGHTFYGFSAPTINAKGNAAFSATIERPTGERVHAIYFGSLTDLQPVLQTGTSITADPSLVVRQTWSPLLNDADRLVIYALLAGEGVNQDNEQAVLVFDNGQLSIVAREGDAAPGAADGAVFSGFSQPVAGSSNSFAINEKGQVVFAAELTGEGIDTSNDSGIWATLPDGSLTLVVQEGQWVEIDGQARQVLDLGFTSSRGRGTTFTDDGYLGLWMSFYDGGEGLYITQVPEPATPLLFGGLALLLGRARRA